MNQIHDPDEILSQKGEKPELPFPGRDLVKSLRTEKEKKEKKKKKKKRWQWTQGKEEGKKKKPKKFDANLVKG